MTDTNQLPPLPDFLPDTNSINVFVESTDEQIRDAFRAYALQAIAQATQAEVTDERLLEIGREWTKEVGWYEFEVNDFIGCAGAILALRPVQGPMNQDEVIAAIKSANISSSTTFWSIFEAGIRAAEAHHGITAQAKKETP